MKKEIFAILKSCLFIASVVVVLDFLIGLFFDGLIKRLPSEGERVAKSYYAFHNVDSDIVIIGSSRAETTYDCEIIMDSLPGYTVYNCGADGQRLIYCNTLINSVLDRYTPKCIVWDVAVGQIGGGDYENLSLVFPFYRENKNVKMAVDEMEGKSFKFSILFNAYRYNATAGRILRAYFFTPKPAANSYGFLPRRQTDNSRILVPEDFTISDNGSCDEKYVEMVNTTLDRANKLGCKMILVISPMYDDFNSDNIYSRKWNELCEMNNAVFIDDSHLEGFVHNNQYAYDRAHVNYEGAEVFSGIFAQQLKNIFVSNTWK